MRQHLQVLMATKETRARREFKAYRASKEIKDFRVVSADREQKEEEENPV